MDIQNRPRRFAPLVVIATVASVVIAGCTVENPSVPAFTGPSEFALQVTMSASPEQLPRDGTSQSVITLTARNAQGNPVPGQRFALAASPGLLSTSEVVTDASGRATFAVVAPPASAVGSSITIQATPIGANADNVPRRVTVALTGPPNRRAPSPSFIMTPPVGAQEANIPIRFDASGTTDEGNVACDCTYSWSFGDGGTASGRIVSHTYTTAGTYTVILTATDDAGSSASVAQTIVIAAIAAPTVTLSSTPSPPLAGQQTTLRATATAATGHSITRYSWNFGDGTSQTTTTPTVTKTYATQGTYVVTVTVTDDVGQTGSGSLQLNITASAVSATIVFSPTDPAANQRVHFTAANATAPNGATIKSYEWNFGDSQVDGGGTASGQTTDHTYSLGGFTYVVQLTITDSNGVVGVVRTNVAVD